MKESDQVKHHAAERRECRQWCTQVLKMRAKLATIEFERRMGAPERATGQLGTVVRAVEHDHFQFGMTQQMAEGDAALGFLEQESSSPLFSVTIAALVPAAPAPIMITSTS
ncbi:MULTISPECIES: hypothetical protein [Paraburkholderia]|uniref:Uncharacterized protein n=1 Tax=Paraburkholderia dipogonis TaxID=1211383 RepID=A0ABW9AZL6_9BURK